MKAMVSKEAKPFRQHLCNVVADIMFQRVIKYFGQGIIVSRYSHAILANGSGNIESGLPTNDYISIFRDRRLRVIFSKALKSARREPVLMLRFCWACFIVMVTSAALACHRVLVCISEAYLQPMFDAPKRYAVGA